MTRKDFTTMFNELLIECLSKPDPMLHLLEWLCSQLMEAEADKSSGLARVNVQIAAPVIGAAIEQRDGTLVLRLCICLSPSLEAAAISRLS